MRLRQNTHRIHRQGLNTSVFLKGTFSAREVETQNRAYRKGAAVGKIEMQIRLVTEESASVFCFLSGISINDGFAMSIMTGFPYSLPDSGNISHNYSWLYFC